MKSKALAKCTAGEPIVITHIYGPDQFKKLLKQFHIDIHAKIQIMDTANRIVFLNSERQQLALSYNEAYDIFGINANEFQQQVQQHKRKILYILSCIIAVLLSFCAAIAFYHLSSINFSLSAKQVNISYGSNFDPLQYVKTLSNAKLVLPTLEYEKPGSYPLTYIAKNHFNQRKQTLIVNVIDDQSPVIELTAYEVMYDDDLQACNFYIKAVKDNVDKDLLSKVICTNELHFINNTAYYDYQVVDAGGNVAKAQLTITKQDKPPADQPATIYSPNPPAESPEPQPLANNPTSSQSESYVEEIYEEYHYEEITYDEGVLVSYE